MSHLYRMSVRRAAALAGAVAITASLAAAAVGASTAQAASFPSITAGEGHTCAIKTDDTATCWGNNAFGQATVPTDLGTVKQITAGTYHSCAIKTNDTVVCWGWNVYGQASVPTDLGAVKQITAGIGHTCAIKTNDTATCWGRNIEGQTDVPTDLGTVKQITAGSYHTCAIKTNDTATCWGYNDYGQASVPTDLGTVKQITAGSYHTCAIKTNGAAACWGDNRNGQASVPAGAFPSLSGALVDLGDASGLDFGDVTAGQRSAVLKSFITSSPSAPDAALTIGTVTLTGSGGAAFQLLSQSCTNGQVLTDGASCPLRVRFTPKIWQRGDISAQVTVTDDSILGTHTIPLTGFALPPASFTLQNFSWALGVGLAKQFNWESSDASKVTLTLTQPVTTTVTVKKGKKVTKKTVTTIKPVTLVANKSAAAGPGVFDRNGKVNGKAAAKGRWTATITAVSARGKASLTQPVAIR